MARKLRIAVSVFFGVLAVALCVLWVRSYNKEGVLTLGIAPGPGFMLGSGGGELSAARFQRIEGAVTRGFYAWENEYAGRRAWDGSPCAKILDVRFGSFFIAASHYLVVLLSASLSAAALVRWNFSLRTLLIATTLFAVVLGLAVWAGR